MIKILDFFFWETIIVNIYGKLHFLKNYNQTQKYYFDDFSISTY